MDKTLFIRSALRFLSGNFPVRAFVGVLIGLTLDGLRSFFVAYFPFTNFANGLDAVPLISEIAVGLLASFSSFILPGRRILPEQVVTYYNIIDEGAARIKMSQHQRALLYQSAFSAFEKKFLTSGSFDLPELARDTLSEEDQKAK